MSIKNKIIIMMLVLLLQVSCRTPMQTTLQSPLNTEIKSIDLPDFLVESRWTLVSVTVGNQPIDIAATLPVHMLIFESDESVDSYSLSFQSNCGEDPSDILQSSSIMKFSPKDKVELSAGFVDSKSCGASKDKVGHTLARLKNSVTIYSVDGDALLWHGIDEASRKPFIIRWERG